MRFKTNFHDILHSQKSHKFTNSYEYIAIFTCLLALQQDKFIANPCQGEHEKNLIVSYLYKRNVWILMLESRVISIQLQIVRFKPLYCKGHIKIWTKSMKSIICIVSIIRSYHAVLNRFTSLNQSCLIFT